MFCVGAGGSAGRQGTSAKFVCPCLGRDGTGTVEDPTGPPEAAVLMGASIGALPSFSTTKTAGRGLVPAALAFPQQPDPAMTMRLLNAKREGGS